MFRYIAEDIAFLLIKNKIVDIEEREVYVYGLEVLLLNISNIIIALIISLITKSMWHFVAFILIFVPLRIFVGGYHAKTSEICFIYTSLVYALTVLIIKLFPLLNQNIVAIIVTTILLIPIIVFSPLENSNNPLGENRKRNKLIAIILTVIDSLIFIILKAMHKNLASNVMIFIAAVSILLTIEIVKRRVNNSKNIIKN